MSEQKEIDYKEIEHRETEYARKHLVGRKISDVRYMQAKEAEDMDWSSRPLVLILDDGTLIWPTSDDEGNNGGTLAGDNGKIGLVFGVM
jgi:hypothetical protein